MSRSDYTSGIALWSVKAVSTAYSMSAKYAPVDCSMFRQDVEMRKYANWVLQNPTRVTVERPMVFEKSKATDEVRADFSVSLSGLIVAHFPRGSGLKRAVRQLARNEDQAWLEIRRNYPELLALQARD